MKSVQLSSFSSLIQSSAKSNKLIVQPRMGFPSIKQMKYGLQAVKNCNADTIGTITIDSFTRQRDYKSAQTALHAGLDLNGYPIVTHTPQQTRNMLNDVMSPQYPIQIRHGSPNPYDIFETMIKIGVDATEGGPISYCLPYTRTPLKDSITAWSKSCRLLASHKNKFFIPHIESFAGCMLGQLCPPSLLIALSILEGMFLQDHGIDNISLSYAQGTSTAQDQAAIAVLRSLAKQYFSNINWHIVIYTYMGVFPETTSGAKKIICDSVHLAKITNSERLIVKTTVESKHIPAVENNIFALELAHQEFTNEKITVTNIDQEEYERIYTEVDFLLNATLNLCSNLSKAILLAFAKGYLDVPYCLHINNFNKTRTLIDAAGYLRWGNTGHLPFPKNMFNKKHNLSSSAFLQSLRYIQQKYDSV